MYRLLLNDPPRPCKVSGTGRYFSLWIPRRDALGAGSAVLQWMYGDLSPRNDGRLSAQVTKYDQSGSFGTDGMASSGYIYVPSACAQGAMCKLHIALHGCGITVLAR